MSLFPPAAASQHAPPVHMRDQDPGATRFPTRDGLHELLMWTPSELLLYGLSVVFLLVCQRWPIMGKRCQ